MPILFILGIALVNAVFLGYHNGEFSKHTLADYKNDPRIYNEMAITMLHTRSLVDKNFLFAEPYRKSPGYPLVLAVAYGVLGERPLSAWVLNTIFWLFSVIILWKISSRFVGGSLAYVPALFMALYWGVATFVIGITSDIFALFLVLSLVYFLSRFLDSGAVRYIFFAGVATGPLLITKPIMLYSLPFLFVSFLLPRRFVSKKNVIYGCIAFSGAVLFLVSWMIYNYSLVGAYQLASGAATLSKRADDIYLTPRRAITFIVASAFGDYIADRISPGYANDPEPHTVESLRRQKAYARSFTRRDKERDLIIQKEFYDELFRMIRERPVRFTILAIPYLFRMNAPTNFEGVEIISLFSGTHQGVPPFMKILILILLRSLWFMFLGLVVVGMIYALKSWREWFTIIWLVIFMNGMYALVSHGEARFIIPVIPFYFLLATFACYKLKTEKALARKILKSMVL